MAPVSPSIVGKVHYKLDFEMRSLGSNTTGTAASLTANESYTLQCLALTCATISVMSSILAFYWFVKMRRTFRHDLIMLLIQSDMFKALWYMIYPIVVFVQGPIANNSKFCQINGFFISVGIEASDFAVLQIALHTALYIFKPRIARGGEGGLYPYRYLAYVCWVLFPLLMASLAFLNERDAYTSEGTYCYLPIRPSWYLLALSWIPRYIIFIIILCIYASIYFYVRYKFHGFTKLGRTQSTPNPSSIDSTEAPRDNTNRNGVPPTPRLNYHRLIPPSRHPSCNGHNNFKDTKLSTDSYRYRPMRPTAGTHQFMWRSFISQSSPIQLPTLPPTAVLSDDDLTLGLTSPQPLPSVHYSSTILLSPRPVHSSLPTPILSPATSWRDNFIRRFSPSGQRSTQDIFSALRPHPNGSQPPALISQLQLVNSQGQSLVDVEMLRTREKIGRQLRFLFIYPLVYIGMWIGPFISHDIQFDDRYAINPPFGLICVTTISICSQAAVDCWLFSTREKPWKHISGTDGTFWGSMKFWSGWGTDPAQKGAGKTREEMVREARDAYKRRDQELAQRRREMGTVILADSRRSERDWWDTGKNGQAGTPGMSPVAEEIADPMNHYQVSDVESSGESILKTKMGSVNGRSV